MTYATRADLEARTGSDELAQRETMLAAGAVGQALADAGALIDGYLAGRYTVPLDPAPGPIVGAACQLARYALLGSAACERSRQDYQDALSWLKDVAAGRYPLAGAGRAAVTAVSARPSTRTAGLQFGAAALKGFK